MSVYNIYSMMETIASEYDLVSSKHNQYAEWLINNATQQEFLTTQRHFRYAVENFGAVLAGVLSKMPQLTKERMSVAENVAEEHGHNNLSNTHKETFLTFLKSMNTENLPLDLRNISIPAESFNQSVGNFVSTHSYYEAAAMVGMIEYLYINMSDLIAKKVNSDNWDSLCEQTHYDVHAVLDIEHARELFEVCESLWNIEEEHGSGIIQQQIITAATLGAVYFTRLYKDLLEVKNDATY